VVARVVVDLAEGFKNAHEWAKLIESSSILSIGLTPL
jgi:hypothetical protein